MSAHKENFVAIDTDAHRGGPAREGEFGTEIVPGHDTPRIRHARPVGCGFTHHDSVRQRRAGMPDGAASYGDRASSA